MLNIQVDNHYTYEDYKKTDEGVRCEIINGVIYDMSPAPSTTHQRLLGFLYLIIGGFLKGKPCDVFLAPFDVFLMEEEQEFAQCKNIIQPDITVICDKSKITEKGCLGAPDFIIEIVSPFNMSNDYIRKLSLYNDYKVKEYWIVSPKMKKIMKYVSDGNNFCEPEHFTFQDVVKSYVLEGLTIDFKEYEGLR